MSDAAHHDREPDDPLAEAARLRAQRRHRWLAEGEQSVARRLAQIGVLGWIIVFPMLVGMFAGRWLDRSLHSGLTWTGALLVVGLALGCWSGWRWVNRA